MGAVLGCGAHDGHAEQATRRSPKTFHARQEQPAAVELVAEHASVKPGGKTRIGVRFTLQEGWHIYAKDPGDAGLPTTIHWMAVEGASFGPLQWPAARAFDDPGNIRTYGYTGSVVLASPLTVNAQAPPDQPLPIRAQVEWLACKELCVPGSAELELALPVRAAPPVLSAHAPLFQPRADSTE